MTITQDYPIEDLDPRIPRIIELRQNGLTWTQVAQEMTLSRKQIYNIRQQENFRYITLELVPQALKILDDAMNDPESSDYLKLESVKEALRNWRSTIPKQIESRNLNLSLSLEKTRSTNAWIEYMTPTEFDDFKRLKDSACLRMSGVEI